MLVQEEPILHGPDQQVALQRLTVELGNLQQAWAWAAAQGWAQELRNAARSLWYVFELRNHFQEGEATFGHAQERLQARRTAGLPADTAIEIAWANLLTYQAMFAFRQGRTAYAKPLLRDAVHCLRSYDDPAALDDALWVYGAVCMFLGEFEEALGALDEARTLRGALQRPWSLVLNHMIQGVIRYEQGNYEESYRLLSEAWKLARPLGDPRHLPFVSRFLSRTAQALGRHTEMVELLQEGLRLAQESGDRFARALALEQLAQGNLILRQVAETERYLAEALALYQEIGDRWSHSRLLNFAGMLALERGDEVTAQQIFAQAFQIAVEGNTPPNALDALVGLATLRTNTGETLSAYTLAAAICHHPASTHQARDRAVQLQQSLAPQLTAAQVVTAQAQAQSAIASGAWVRL
jgi:tetratricopeptide (TPR) repeat protein